MENEHVTMNMQSKKSWQEPQMEVLEIRETMNGGEGVWQYVWDGDFWKIDLLTS